jgi:hypothetical protein
MCGMKYAAVYGKNNEENNYGKRDANEPKVGPLF